MHNEKIHIETIRRRFKHEEPHRRSEAGRRWAWHHLTEVMPVEKVLRCRLLVETIVGCLLYGSSIFYDQAKAWVTAHLTEPMVLAVLYFEASRSERMRNQVRTEIHGPVFTDDLPDNVRPIWKQILRPDEHGRLTWGDCAKHFGVPRTALHRPRQRMLYQLAWLIMEVTPADNIPHMLAELFDWPEWHTHNEIISLAITTLGRADTDTSPIVAQQIERLWWAIAKCINGDWAPYPFDKGHERLVKLLRPLVQIMSTKQLKVLWACAKAHKTVAVALAPELLKAYPEADDVRSVLGKYRELHHHEDRVSIDVDDLTPFDEVVAALPLEHCRPFISHPYDYHDEVSRNWWNEPLTVRLAADPVELGKFVNRICRKRLKDSKKASWELYLAYLEKIPEEQVALELEPGGNFWEYAPAWVQVEVKREERYKFDRWVYAILKNWLLPRNLATEPLFCARTARLFHELGIPIDDSHFINWDLDIRAIGQDDDRPHGKRILDDKALVQKVIDLTPNAEKCLEALLAWANAYNHQWSFLIEWLPKAIKKRPALRMLFLRHVFGRTVERYNFKPYGEVVESLGLWEKLKPKERTEITDLLVANHGLIEMLRREYPRALDHYLGFDRQVDFFFAAFPEAIAEDAKAYYPWLLSREEKERERLSLEATTTPLDIRKRLLKWLLTNRGEYNGKVWFKWAIEFADEPAIREVAVGYLFSYHEEERDLAVELLWPDRPPHILPADRDRRSYRH